MIGYLIKTYVCSKVSKVLATNDITKIRVTVSSWIDRLEKILSLFKGVLGRIEDNEFTTDEADETIEDVENIVKEW